MAVKRVLVGTARQLSWAALYFVIGALVVTVVVGVRYLEARPDLSPWHTANLDEEFTANSDVASFAEYLQLEGRLFVQLEREVYAPVGDIVGSEIVRYERGSLSDPTSYPHDWNRSFELPVPRAAAGVLLIHGLSDSPYSMRSLAERFRSEGFHVLGLRVPGHGTAPVGLTTVSGADMQAAVRLAMRHLNDVTHGAPLSIVGYSNGGALAVLYALAALEEPALPQPQRLVLLSPEIGITPLAALAVWQERLGSLLGLEKLRWQTILPEYDPYKYGSFAVNAGRLAHELTLEIQSRITRLTAAGSMRGFPRTLAFQSVTDATVSASALVKGLLDRLPANGSELVLFDINRLTLIEPILKQDPAAELATLLHDATRSFAVTVIANENENSARVVAHTRLPGASQIAETPLGLRWPDGVYSLAHVSLPFPPRDPIYGGLAPVDERVIHLGRLALRGERGVLQISASDMLRLRWNPFHAYVADRSVSSLSEPVAN